MADTKFNYPTSGDHLPLTSPRPSLSPPHFLLTTLQKSCSTPPQHYPPLTISIHSKIVRHKTQEHQLSTRVACSFTSASGLRHRVDWYSDSRRSRYLHAVPPPPPPETPPPGGLHLPPTFLWSSPLPSPTVSSTPHRALHVTQQQQQAGSGSMAKRQAGGEL
ncbi:hypothetical protein E2C01_014363 [Portunus trituberculatus]|uniref:Uncharacterized protein n=1 Tax=Portunus trituberculatus TaxID=210409 RepID=A0A5B7DIZ4_PORTR|nr:hypothetical protein [Portunus trituberculatus]